MRYALTTIEQSPVFARLLLAVALRRHAIDCAICRAGANVVREEGKAAGYAIINHCGVARLFCAAWRETLLRGGDTWSRCDAGGAAGTTRTTSWGIGIQVAQREAPSQLGQPGACEVGAMPAVEVNDR